MRIAKLPLRVSAEPHGRVRLTLRDGDVVATELTIDALQLCDGRGHQVSLGGVGNVATAPSHRRRGLARALLEHAVGRMQADGLDGSLLYGIDDFYDRLGWRSCGDERWVRIPLDVPLEWPAGGVVTRRLRLEDMSALILLHARLCAGQRGALTRVDGGRVWSRLDPAEVIVAERAGALVGWAWRGRGSVAERDTIARREPTASVWSELQAVDMPVARALVSAATQFTRESATERGRSYLLTGAGDDWPLRRAVRSGLIPGTLVDELRPAGGAMLQPFTPLAHGLGGDLYQSLADRF
jgi:hypothetical protein